MFSLEHVNTHRRVGVWSLVGLLLLPLVVAGGFLLATWKSNDRLDRVQAAVVNDDKPIKINGQLVPLGRQLAGGLVNGNDTDPNFSWVLTDADDAASGLQSGRYAAVVTIPKSFSADATSYSKSDAAEVEPATLGVTTSEVTGISDPVVGQAITAAATKALNTQLTESYLKNIYLGFNTLGKQFDTISDAAGKLSDGTNQLSDGLDKTADGTGSLATGLDQLDTGGAKLSAGAAQLSTGTTQLAGGLDTFADKTAALPGGARKLANGAQQAADGVDQLADGVTGVSKGLTTYQRALRKQAATTAASVKPPSQPGGSGALLPTTCPRTEPALTDAQCQVFLQTLGAAVQQVSEGAKTAAIEAARYAGAQGAAKALEGAADGLGTRDPKTGQSLLSGTAALAAGEHKAAKGLHQLADGTDQLADGLPAVSKGLRTTATGAAKLATGVKGLSTGIATYADGVHQTSTGAAKLSAGMVKLADGGDKLADGTSKLADGLAKGKDKVPSYNKVTRDKLSSVVTTPVITPKVDSVFSDVATTTLLAVLALWIGGLASYLVLRAVSARVLASMKSSGRLALQSLLPGAVIAAVQAVVLTVMLQALLQVDSGHLAGLAGFALLTGLSFAAINQALVAWFGGVGRFISVVLVVAAAAGAITSALPEVFDTIQPLLPLTPALAGFRSIVTGAGGTGASVGLLLVWLIVGVAASVLAVARRRVAAPLIALPA